MLPNTYQDMNDTSKLSALEANIQNKFIANVYTILSIQLVVTFGMNLSCYYSETATKFMLQQRGLLIISILITFLSLFLSFCYGKSYPVNYIILAVFTLAESYGITYICLFYQATGVLLAWGLTLSIFIGLSIYVHLTKQDFNYLGAGLFASLWVLLLGGLIQWIWLPYDQLLNTFLAILGSIIACGYILYDTSDIMLRLTPDDFVYACISLYIDVIMLFIRLLELFGEER